MLSKSLKPDGALREKQKLDAQHRLLQPVTLENHSNFFANQRFQEKILIAVTKFVLQISKFSLTSRSLFGYRLCAQRLTGPNGFPNGLMLIDTRKKPNVFMVFGFAHLKITQCSQGVDGFEVDSGQCLCGS